MESSNIRFGNPRSKSAKIQDGLIKVGNDRAVLLDQQGDIVFDLPKREAHFTLEQGNAGHSIFDKKSVKMYYISAGGFSYPIIVGQQHSSGSSIPIDSKGKRTFKGLKWYSVFIIIAIGNILLFLHDSGSIWALLASSLVVPIAKKLEKFFQKKGKDPVNTTADVYEQKQIHSSDSDLFVFLYRHFPFSEQEVSGGILASSVLAGIFGGSFLSIPILYVVRDVVLMNIYSFDLKSHKLENIVFTLFVILLCCIGTGITTQKLFMRYKSVASNNKKPLNNYFDWAFLSAILFLPTGIVSVVYSNKVNGLYHAGDLEGALIAAKKAKKWALASVIISLLGIALWIVLQS